VSTLKKYRLISGKFYYGKRSEPLVPGATIDTTIDMVARYKNMFELVDEEPTGAEPEQTEILPTPEPEPEPEPEVAPEIATEEEAKAEGKLEMVRHGRGRWTVQYEDGEPIHDGFLNKKQASKLME